MAVIPRLLFYLSCQKNMQCLPENDEHNQNKPAAHIPSQLAKGRDEGGIELMQAIETKQKKGEFSICFNKST